MAFGNFTKFNGVLCNRIARLADDGSIDTTFNSAGMVQIILFEVPFCNQTIKLLSLELSHLTTVYLLIE
jgi:hypothetical protein